MCSNIIIFYYIYTLYSTPYTLYLTYYGILCSANGDVMHRRLRLISFAPRANAVALICLWAPPGLGGLRQCDPWTSPFRALFPSMEPYPVQFLCRPTCIFSFLRSSFFLSGSLYGVQRSRKRQTSPGLCRVDPPPKAG